MPADRLLHPKAGHSRKVSLLTDMEYRVWTQYLLTADDFGVMRATAITLQADNDALAARKPTQIQRAIDLLVSSRLLRAFEHQGLRYLYQHDWQTWQKVSYPRGTDNPCPPPGALAECDEPTQELFKLHPGGKGRKVPKRSENVPRTVPECSENESETFPTTRAGAPADRLTANANGYRLTANGEDGHQLFQRFIDAYPEGRRKGGYLVQQAFLDTLGKVDGGFDALLLALENHKASEQWQTPKLIPGMDTWFAEERWRQRLEPPKVLSPKSPWPGWKPQEVRR